MNSILIKYRNVIIAAVVFVAVLTFFTLDMKPQNDIAYHILNKEKIIASAGNISDELVENSYLKIKGTIDLDSVVMQTNFSETKLTDLNFRLRKFPKNLVVHLRQGDFFNQIKEIHDNGAQGIFSDLKDEDKLEDDEYLFEMLTALLESTAFEGRLYKSNSISEAFSSYYLKDDLDIDGYYYEMDEEFNFSPSIFSSRSEGETYWVLAVDEKPSSSYLFETNFPIFLIFIAIGIGVIIYLLKRKPNKK